METSRPRPGIVTLAPLSTRFPATREALHQIAFFAVAPARYLAEQRMGLAATPGGFGTPPVEGKVMRVEGATLVLEGEDAIATQTITTVRAACEFFGHDYKVEWFTVFGDPLAPTDPDRPLQVDDEDALTLAEWFQYGTGVLERLRSHGNDDDDVSEVQLWPEHFDPACELGDAEAGQRASFGASPGDADHPEPYLYVSPWGDIDRSSEYWNDVAFGGASLGYSKLMNSRDPVGKGLDFLLRGYRSLQSA